METSSEKNVATSIHLSTLTQYFIPFGSFIFPILLWSFKRNSDYVNQHGKSVVNFQLSVLLYSLVIFFMAVIGVIAFAVNNFSWTMTVNEFNNFELTNLHNLAGLGLIIGIAVLLLSFIKISEFILIIIGTVAASEGKLYQYPLTINFIKTTLFESSAEVQPNVSQ